MLETTYNSPAFYVSIGFICCSNFMVYDSDLLPNSSVKYLQTKKNGERF
jgi:hypothetical protein